MSLGRRRCLGAGATLRRRAQFLGTWFDHRTGGSARLLIGRVRLDGSRAAPWRIGLDAGPISIAEPRVLPAATRRLGARCRERRHIGRKRVRGLRAGRVVLTQKVGNGSCAIALGEPSRRLVARGAVRRKQRGGRFAGVEIFGGCSAGTQCRCHSKHKKPTASEQEHPSRPSCLVATRHVAHISAALRPRNFGRMRAPGTPPPHLTGTAVAVSWCDNFP